jgi:hypothetical protein
LKTVGRVKRGRQFWCCQIQQRVPQVVIYRHLGNGWSVANQLVRHKKLKQQRTGAYEIYRITQPETAEEELLTEIHLPLKS